MFTDYHDDEGNYGAMTMFGREEKYQRLSDYVVLTVIWCFIPIAFGAFLFSAMAGTITLSLAVCIYVLWKKKSLEDLRGEAKKRELALDYDSAIEIWDSLKDIEEAARVRKLKIKQGAMKVDQTVIQGDQITKTKIKDSVVNKSNFGGKSSKAEELRDAKSLFEEGLIDNEEYKQMKKEILGK